MYAESIALLLLHKPLILVYGIRTVVRSSDVVMRIKTRALLISSSVQAQGKAQRASKKIRQAINLYWGVRRTG